MYELVSRSVTEDIPAVTRADIGIQASFWEKMERRMTQPQPKPTLFDVDPFLRFRSNFRDQVESRASLSDII